MGIFQGKRFGLLLVLFLWAPESRLSQAKPSVPQALAPRPLSQGQQWRKWKNALSQKNLLLEAQSRLCMYRNIRGLIELRERRYGRMAPAQSIQFLMTRQNAYYQWLKGANYRRRVLYRAQKEGKLIWLKEAQGNWRQVSPLALFHRSKHLRRGGELFFAQAYHYRKSGYCFFWQGALLGAYERYLEALWLRQKEITPVRTKKWRGRRVWQLSLTDLKLTGSGKASQGFALRGGGHPWQQLLARASRVRLWLDRWDRLPRKILVYGQGRLLVSVFFRNIEVNSPISQEEFKLFRLEQRAPRHGSGSNP